MLWILWSLLEILRFAVKFAVFMDCFGELSPRKDGKREWKLHIVALARFRIFCVESCIESSLREA